jgi:hypothetical protein
MIDLTGQRFRRLVAVNARAERRFGRSQIFWLCRCDCGNEKWVLGENLRAHRTLSCGCLHDEGRPRAAYAKRRDPEYKQGYNQVYYQANKERLDAYTRQYYQDHPETMRAWHSEYRTLNAETLRPKRRQWELDNAALLRANNIRRRHSEEQRTPAWVDMESLNQIYRDCPTGMEVDHIVPLKGKTLEGYPISGLHVPWNLQYLPRSANRAKKNRMRIEDHSTIG